MQLFYIIYYIDIISLSHKNVNIKAEKIVIKRKPAPKNDADFLNLSYTAFF